MIWNKKEEEDSLPDIPQTIRPFNKNNSQIIGDDDEEHIESIKSFEKNDLPSFPDSPMSKGFSQSAIKDAVSSQDIEKIPLPPKEDNEMNFSSSSPSPSIHSAQGSFIEPNPFLSNPVIEERKEPEIISKINSVVKPPKTIVIPHSYPEDAPHPPSINPQKTTIPKTVQPRIQKPKVEEKTFVEDEEINEIRSENVQKEKTSDVFIKIDKFYTAKKALNTIKQDIKEIEDLLIKIRETKIKEERELSTWEKNISTVKSDIAKVNESLFEKSI